MSKEQTPMNSDRIKEIQEETGLPNSVSVQQALLKVWNECEQYHKQQIKAKVLEALEREFKKVAFMLPDGIPLKGDIDYITGEQHYETEVKPRYER